MLGQPPDTTSRRASVTYVPMELFDTPAWRVGELIEHSRAVMREVFPGTTWVEGEISGLNRSAAGHVYFNLVDSTPTGNGRSTVQPELGVALFMGPKKAVNAKLRESGGVRMENGTRVRIGGHVDVYARGARLQLKMTDIDPAFTLGELAAAKAALLAALGAEQLLDRNASIPLPRLPTRLAVVTSIGSAAHADVMHELGESGWGLDVTVIDTRVQGGEAPASIVRSLERASRLDVDIVLVTRGGGAATDLAAFDSEPVARAVATCPRPVWCGVGHETDSSVIDAVAGRSFKTPTACAAGVVEHLSSAVDQLEDRWRRVRTGSTAVIDAHRHRLDTVEASLGTAARRAMDRADQRLEHATSLLRAYDPANTLARGWSITRTSDGDLATVATMHTDALLVTQLADGTVSSTVTGFDPTASDGAAT